MKPYSVAVCFVKNASGIGFATSDPYLSSATPIAAFSTEVDMAPAQQLRDMLQVS